MKITEAKEILMNKGYEVEASTVKKNGIELDALSIGSGRIRPTIYASVVCNIDTEEELVKLVETALADIPELDVSDLLNQEYVLSHIISCVRHQTDDETILKFPVFDDLEEYFRISIQDEEKNMSIVVTKAILEQIGIDADLLRSAARNNIRKEANIRSMSEVIKEMIGIEDDIPMFDEDLMYVGSMNGMSYGASIILLDDVLNAFCEQKGIKEMVIIPSSIHEVIFVPTNMEEANLNDMVQEVNANEVAETERLSDHVYHYVAS